MRSAMSKSGTTKHKFVPQSYATDIKQSDETQVMSSPLWKDVKNVAMALIPTRSTTRMIAIGLVAAVATGIYMSKRRSKLSKVQRFAKKILH